jgi:hypothetical protein
VGRALGRVVAGRGSRAIWGNCAMGLAAPRLAALLGSRAARRR